MRVQTVIAIAMGSLAAAALAQVAAAPIEQKGVANGAVATAGDEPIVGNRAAPAPSRAPAPADGAMPGNATLGNDPAPADPTTHGAAPVERK